ncbi:MAG TPA: helix-hairpin-helix domain-containing protein [Xanthobacteraceae bacterium]|jgi:DNA uptake protein ComE-like DNA-binding protein|nr:helix-hairpin-helix domain-containing protein [Xanthobacteraceae bacterium]
MTMNRAGGFFGMPAIALALLVTHASPAAAQAATGLINPNTATESELQALPAMTPAIVKGIIERRPFKSVVELNKFLLERKVTPEQAREFYRKAFVPIDLNTGTREEFMLIPGVGSRMSAEFMEYRPWKSWAQFDREIGKYVGQAETDRFKPYVFIPAN